MVTDLLVFLVAVIISCILGLSHLIVDYFKGRKSSKGETHMHESEQKTILQLRKSEDGDSFKSQIPQASSASNIPKAVSSQAPTIVKEREVITRAGPSGPISVSACTTFTATEWRLTRRASLMRAVASADGRLLRLRHHRKALRSGGNEVGRWPKSHNRGRAGS